MGEPSDMDFLLGLPAVLAERHWNRHAAGYYLDGDRMRAACRAIDALVARAEQAERERDDMEGALIEADEDVAGVTPAATIQRILRERDEARHALSRARTDARREGVEEALGVLEDRRLWWVRTASSLAAQNRDARAPRAVVDTLMQVEEMVRQLLAAPEPGAASPAATTHDTPKGKE